MESCSTPLQVLPQSKLIEYTTKYIQDKLNTEKLGQNWSCPQQLLKLLAPMTYYKSKSQYFPTENILHLDADASQLDMSSRGKYSVPIENPFKPVSCCGFPFCYSDQDQLRECSKKQSIYIGNLYWQT